MIRSVYYHQDEMRESLSEDQMRAAIANNDGLLWVSIENESPEMMQHLLGDIFHFHPLAIEDAISTGFQVPKVDQFHDHIFIVMHDIRYVPVSHELTTAELDIFLGHNYLVTSHRAESMHPVERVWSLMAKDERLHQSGPDFLCHAVIDTLVDDYTPVLDQLEESMERLEDQVLDKPKRDVLDEIIRLKHSMLSLRRIVAPEREIMVRLTRNEFSQITPERQIYFRDIYDHLVRLYELIDGIRDIASGAMDIYLNSTSLRLNEVMKALTVVSTIFLPLSFVAGVYGMNFKHMPELEWILGYPMIWLVFFLIGAGMLLFFKKKGWF